MKRPKNYLLVKLCEILPSDFLHLDLTLFEKNGKCTKETEHCIYCMKGPEDYFCNKKTYTLSMV